MQRINVKDFDVALPAGVGRRFEAQLRHLLDAKAKNSFKSAYLRSECFSKYLDELKVPASVRAEAAIAKWQAAELKNSRTNCHLLTLEQDLGWIHSDRLLMRIRTIIRKVLGPLTYPDILSGAVFTNGASTRVPRSTVASVVKLTGELHITESAIKHWLAFASGSRLSKQPLKVVPSSMLFTVPKKSEIDRCACKEPEANMLLQRSVGLAISAKLKRIGIDLSDQSRNQHLASIAQKEGLATIDLSSASDTISSQLVMLLLPGEWWSLLDDLRSHSVLLPDGTTHRLEMFSSMGNGFTFELESLIFYAIAKAMVWETGIRGRVSVYGDDIIAPSRVVGRLSRILSLFGFTTNKKKTHHKGPFRESCGKHYWNGFDVTPFYVRGETRTFLDLIKTLNHLLEWDGRGWGFFLDEELLRFWERWSDIVPAVLYGGYDPGDPTCLVTDHAPRKRILSAAKKRGFNQEAGLTSWFHRAEYQTRTEESVVLIDPRDVHHFEVRVVTSCGERSSWTPAIAYGKDLGSGVSK